MKINEAEFNEWCQSQSVTYASLSVRIRPNSTVLARLKFDVQLSGGYQVTWGNETLYDGQDFSEATRIFEEIAEKENPTATQQQA